MSDAMLLALQARPTHTPDGIELRIAADHERGDILRDRFGRAWLWEGNDSVPRLQRVEAADEPYADTRANDARSRKAKARLSWYLSQLGDA